MFKFSSTFSSDNRKAKFQKPPRRCKWPEAFAIVALLSVCGARVGAQQPGKIPRVGFLAAASTGAAAPFIEGFRRGLRELGYIEGKNIVLEIRGGEASPGQISAHAAEFVRLKVDVIVAGGTDPTRAVKEATSTIPIVMRYDGDPVRAGVVASLARPGGNITGMASLTQELNGKRFELLTEVVPGAKRIAVLTALSNRARFMARTTYKEMEAAARVLGVTLQVVHGHDRQTIDEAFETMTNERAQALNLIPSALYIQHRERIIRHAAKNRLPAIYFRTLFVKSGGLLSYSPDFADEFRRLATHVDKILKGAKPADLPVERPKKFDFLINLKVAHQMGLTVPPNVLVRADRVIR